LEPWASGTLSISNTDNARISGIWFGAGTVQSSVTDCFIGTEVPDITTWTVSANCVGTTPQTEGYWTSYTPTLTCGSGTLSNATAYGRYRVIGKTVEFKSKIDITTNGSCAGRINVTVPFASLTAQAAYAALSGAEVVLTGKALSVLLPYTSTQVQVRNADGTYPGADNAQLVIGGTYERN
jgi:hypothetical protein